MECEPQLGDTVANHLAQAHRPQFMHLAQSRASMFIAVVKRDGQVVSARRFGAQKSSSSPDIDPVAAARAHTPQRRGVVSPSRPSHSARVAVGGRYGPQRRHRQFLRGTGRGHQSRARHHRLHYNKITLPQLPPHPRRRAQGLRPHRSAENSAPATPSPPRPLTELNRVFRAS